MWCLSGAWGPLALATALSAIAGAMEVVTAWFLGLIVDLANDRDPGSGILDQWPMLLAFVLFLVILRPISFGLSAASNSVIVQPNVLPLVLSRLHRWTLGQAVTFFDNDFAGRIAQKQMQAARAVTDVASETINTIAFALASLLVSAVFLLSIDGWMALALSVWIVLYLGLIRLFLPRVRGKSAARAGARAMVTGQVVDTITNIKTVKLFAHADHEDRAALAAMSGFRDTALDFGVLSAWFRLALMTLAGLLPVILVGGALALWSDGKATAGDIAAAGAVSIRIAQMTGWVSFTLMSIYASIGEVEDGMRTLTPPHTLADEKDAITLDRITGAVKFEKVSFAYGRTTGGLDEVDLTIKPGEKLGIVGASGAGKSTLVALLLRLYDAEKGRILVDGHDVRGVTQESLRRQVAMVTQETAMFNRSARDNILYGRPDATEEEVVLAAKQAEADEFITGLQDYKGRTGYDTFLGERGV
ncbi:MAG: ABC transporter ATP-binding protein/permease, partial [Paracoccaceae bacterium]|nr:ABC transporter ATP-binding protein/permease [Paracoccaceae bacterium]